MGYREGTLKVACAWMVILMQSLDAGHEPKKHVAAVSCRPKQLTAHTESLVSMSLTSFDKANGNNLGIWSPGFPELQVHQNATLDRSKVQCSLLFMAQGLEKVLEDQRNNLNPEDVSLHKMLRDTISTVNWLAECVKEILGGECSPKPSLPKMPTYAFERKQWSHTLLKTAKVYLNWLKHKLVVQKKKKQIKHRVTQVKRHKYLEGSGYLL